MNIGVRVTLIRKKLELTQQEFGYAIGLKQNTIGQMENGSRVVADRTILLLCERFDVNESWLRTGEGEMFIPMSRDEKIAAFVGKTLSSESDSFQRRFISMLSRLGASDWEVLEKMVLEMTKDRGVDD